MASPLSLKALGIGLMMGSLAFAEDPGIEAGRNLYLNAGGYGCAVCHGPVADGAGQVGGAIRGASREQLDKAFVEQPTMVLLGTSLNDTERTQLIQYLAHLAEMPLVEMTYNGMAWQQNIPFITAGQRVQFSLFNDSFNTLSIEFMALEADEQPLILQPLERRVISWTAYPGAFELPSTDFLVVNEDTQCVHIENPEDIVF